MNLSLLLSQLFNGLQTGSIYALVALGYSMVYGIILLLNFAHGDIIMVGAYAAFYAMTNFHLHPIVSVIIAVITSTLLGVVIEKVAYTPLRKAPRLSLLITAIGISFLLENGAQLLFGSDTKSMDPIVPGNISLGSVTISNAALLTIVVTIIAMAALTVVVQKTKLGKAMRAVSEDMGAAQLMGISLNRTISFTFAIGSALAGIGSVLYLCAYQQASPTMGSMLGLKAFVAAVLGGIGSIPGAMIGGFAIGLLEALVSAVGLSIWKDGVVFAILIVVLLVKPTGILGRPQMEKCKEGETDYEENTLCYPHSHAAAVSDQSCIDSCAVACTVYAHSERNNHQLLERHSHHCRHQYHSCDFIEHCNRLSGPAASWTCRLYGGRCIRRRHFHEGRSGAGTSEIR